MNKIKTTLLQSFCIFIACHGIIDSAAQSETPDLQNRALWSLTARTIRTINQPGYKGIQFDDQPGAGLLRLNNSNLSDGTIEFDVKGRNIPQKSFVGIAFHIQNDTTYDAIYFRPFNFKNADTLRRPRSVQYISLPKYDWPRLREEHPGKYENKVNPVPDPEEWFHAKVVILNGTIKVYVNQSTWPSLVVEKLSGVTTGGFGLWVGNGSDGSFANLTVHRTGH